MAWIEPKTNWSPADICTYEDLNRIANNIGMMGDIIPTQLTANDFGTLSWWITQTTTLRNILLANGITHDFSMACNYEALNEIETYTKIAKDRITLNIMQEIATQHAGDPIFSGEFYAGGF